MELGLKDKVVLITGSSRGIGKTIASSFLAEGARVIVTGRDRTTLNETLEEFLNTYGAEFVCAYQGDMTNLDDIAKCVNLAVKKFNKIDILIANIGTGKSKAGLEANQSEWERIIKLNLIGSINIVKEIVPLMKKNGNGSIVIISSIAGCEVLGAPITYSAAKSALISSSKNLSYLLAKDNIRVNTVAPGNIFFKGGRWEEIIRENPDIIENYIKRNVPMQRFGKSQEIADAVLFLASERASFITGACLVVDGGETRSIL